jgi:hypothetical protein
VKPEDAGRKPYALLYEAIREAVFAAGGQLARDTRLDRVVRMTPSESD